MPVHRVLTNFNSFSPRLVISGPFISLSIKDTTPDSFLGINCSLGGYYLPSDAIGLTRKLAYGSFDLAPGLRKRGSTGATVSRPIARLHISRGLADMACANRTLGYRVRLHGKESMFASTAGEPCMAEPSALFNGVADVLLPNFRVSQRLEEKSSPEGLPSSSSTPSTASLSSDSSFMCMNDHLRLQDLLNLQRCSCPQLHVSINIGHPASQTQHSPREGVGACQVLRPYSSYHRNRNTSGRRRPNTR